jgi:hypothetical protein
MIALSYVAVPYPMALSEAEERREIEEYIDYVGYDFRGFAVKFCSTANGKRSGPSARPYAAKFIAEWGGITLDEAARSRVTDRRGVPSVPLPAMLGAPWGNP